MNRLCLPDTYNTHNTKVHHYHIQVYLQNKNYKSKNLEKLYLGLYKYNISQPGVILLSSVGFVKCPPMTHAPAES